MLVSDRHRTSTACEGPCRRIELARIVSAHGRNTMNWRNMLSLSAIAALALALVAGSAVGAAKAKVSKKQLVGSWSLVSITPSSPTSPVYRPNDGVVIFDAR